MERSAMETRVHLSNRTLRTPRAAAVAGIIFAVLRGTSNVLLYVVTPVDSWTSSEWLESQMKVLVLALGLLPFAGIAFLWFMAVVRDRLKHLEDQFFSTLFFGSGYLYLAMIFTGAAVASGTLAVYSYEPRIPVGVDVYVVARAVIDRVNNLYALRMAGMHMLVLGTIWLRTQVMPRWLAIVTYALALILLIGGGISQWVSMVFPTWVLVISVYVLVLNYLVKHDAIEVHDGMTLNSGNPDTVKQTTEDRREL